MVLRLGATAARHRKLKQKQQRSSSGKQHASSGATTPDAFLPFMSASEYQAQVRQGRQLLFPNLHPHS